MQKCSGKLCGLSNVFRDSKIREVRSGVLYYSSKNLHVFSKNAHRKQIFLNPAIKTLLKGGEFHKKTKAKMRYHILASCENIETSFNL